MIEKMTFTLYGIVIAVILFMINYLSMRLNRIEEGLPKKVKYFSEKMSGKAINDIVNWIKSILRNSKLDSQQREVFSSSLQEYKNANRDVTIMKTILLGALILLFLEYFI